MNATLTQESQQLQQTIQRGIDWLNQFADPAKRLGTLNELGKLRRRAKRLEQAAGRRPALAMFGISQVGKSYLVSNLARIPGQNLLQIETAGIPATTVRDIIGHDGPISFIDDINPVGGGTEATGVVTRFTTAHQNDEGGYLLRLLSQIDLVKIMAIGYQFNIINSDYPKKINATGLDNQLVRIEMLRQSELQPGMTEDDVLDLRDYLGRLFEGELVGKLRDYQYWEKVASLIPYLRPADRWQAFAPIWHEDGFMTKVFQKISEGLVALNFMTEVRVGLEAVAPQAQTIVDIMRIYELDDPARNKGDVNVTLGSGQRVALNRSVLTALTAELVLPLPRSLENEASRQFLQYADILDFPGARSMEGAPEDVFQTQTDVKKKMDPFLRGKVFFLFSSYNDAFGISSLLFCMHDMQSEVKGTLNINSMINEWVRTNVGASPDERMARQLTLNGLVPETFRQGVDRINPFFLILTKINIEIDACDPEKTARTDLYDQIWAKRLGQFFDEEMAKITQDKWTTEWSAGYNGPPDGFKNTFMIRDPRYCKLSYTTVDGQESFSSRYVPVFDGLERSFTASTYTQLHFHNPLTAWREATQPNRNGVDYLVKYLLPACHPAIKAEQIRIALDTVRQEIGRQLCGHYEGGSVEEKLRRARERRDRVVRPVGRLVMEKQLGQFLASMTIAEQYMGGQDSGMWDRELLRQVMVHPESITKQPTAVNGHGPEAPQQGGDLDVFLGDLLGNFDTGPAATAAAPVQKTPTLATHYAENLLGQWVVQLKDNTDNRAFLRRFGLAKEEADIVVEEVVRSMERDSLTQRLSEQVTSYLEQINNLEVVLSIGRATINEFVQTLGWSRVSADDKVNNKAIYQPGQDQVVPIFEDVAVPIPEKKALQTDLDDPARRLYSQWFRGFYQAFEYNVLREANLSDPERARINGLLEAIIQELNYQC